MTVKISRVRHVVITSIIFVLIIIGTVVLWKSEVDRLKMDAGEKVHRVAAKVDIAPGTRITSDMVELVEVHNVLPGVKDFAYRVSFAELASEKVADTKEIKNDDLWVAGKVATEHIYKGEWINTVRLKDASEIDDSETRLYNIQLDSKATGAYNINLEEEVDICVIYDDINTVRKYQNLPDNKLVDVVLAKRKIADIRDESGNSAMTNAAVVPGYVCFRLTYDEINKIELAKRQGSLFIGKVGDYYAGEPVETFMAGTKLPEILPGV